MCTLGLGLSSEFWHHPGIIILSLGTCSCIRGSLLNSIIFTHWRRKQLSQGPLFLLFISMKLTLFKLLETIDQQFKAPGQIGYSLVPVQTMNNP